MAGRVTAAAGAGGRALRRGRASTARGYFKVAPGLGTRAHAGIGADAGGRGRDATCGMPGDVGRAQACLLPYHAQ